MKPVRGMLLAGLLLVAGLIGWLLRTQVSESGAPKMIAARPVVEAPAPILPDARGRPAEALAVSSADGASLGAERGARAPTRLAVHVTWASDGSPAEDIVLSILAWNGLDPLRHVIPGRTDARGDWTLEPAPPGKVTVYSDRAGSVAGEVREGETTELVLAIPPGTLVRGIVLGPQGQAIPDAEIWLSGYGNNSEGAVVSSSGADGRFVLRDVAPWHSVGARAAGHVPSDLVQLGQDPPAELDVELRLGTEGATLNGLVVDANQVPVADAFVLVGPEHGFPGPDPRRAGGGPPPLPLHTTADGRFMAADLPPGTIPVGVVAEGQSPWTGWKDVAAGETVDLLIELQPSALLEGTVHDGNGAPIEGARIFAGPRYGDIGSVDTTSDDSGHYVLRGFPLGEQQMVARKKNLGEDKRTFHVFAGQSYLWDPVLTLGLQIVGRLIDESGAPVEGLHVQCEHARLADGWRKTANVAADGSFVLPNCDNVEHVLSVFRADWSFPPLLTMTGVRPGPDEVCVVLTAGARLLATVSGRVLDENGQPPAELHVALMPEGQPMGASGRADAVTGVFVVEDVAIGDYRLRLSAKDKASLILPVLDVLAGERRELGTLQFPAPGVVVARLVLPPGLDASKVDCTLKSVDGMFGTASFAGREEGLLERHSEPMAPGDWLLCARGNQVVSVTLPVRVEAGRTTRVDVSLEQGVRQDFHFLMPYAESHRFELRLHDANGALVVEEARDATPFPDRNESRGIVVVVLRPGRYAVAVTLDGKDALQTAIDVPEGVAEAPDVTLTLH